MNEEIMGMTPEEQEEVMDKFIDMINEKYAEPKKAFDEACEEYTSLLMDFQTVLAVGMDNHALLMTKSSVDNIIKIMTGISGCRLINIFAGIKDSPVTTSFTTASALWGATCFSIGRYNSEDHSNEDIDENGDILHVIASVIAVFELLQHALAFANFEDTIDKTEYMELFNQLQKEMGLDIVPTIYGSDDFKE